MDPRPLSDFGLPSQIPLPSRPKRIGVIGLGGIAQAHLPAYRAAGWTVAAAADIDPARRSEAERVHGLPRVYADYRDLVADPEVEVISLLTQPNVREAVVDACAAAGKPVQTEKPLGPDLATCERLITRAAGAGIALSVSQNYRWFPGPFAATGFIEGGWIGRPYLASIQLHGTQDRDLAGHPFYSTCTDFLTVQWNTHLADLIRGWMGADPVRVCARTSRMPGQAFASDNLLVSVTDFGPHGTGHLLHSELHRGGLASDQVRIEGDAGTLLFSLWSDTLTLRSDRIGPTPVTVACKPEGFLSAFCGPMADLMLALEQGREPRISARRNLATIRQVLAEHASAAAGGTWQSLASSP
jgi:predicted dehydrogenase